MKKRAVVLINVGTPDAPDTASVRRYLREFLSDPRVIDLNPVGRWALLNFVILPFRPKHSARAYQAVWTPEGSPLLVASQRQRAGLAERLPDDLVLLAMRYGSPSLADAARAIEAEGVGEVLLVPLYPQYALASTASGLEGAQKALGALPNPPKVTSVPAFFGDPGFLRAWEVLLQEALAKAGPVDHVVFSYHGLPERQVKATDPTGAHCLAGAGCCDALGPSNQDCYRAQCFATSRALSQRLSLASTSTCFQSRLGRTPWIQPFSDQVLPALAAQGKKRVLVACPSFVTDCLETLEEVGLRLAQSFRDAGGESFALAPCLNDHPAWLDALAELCRAKG
jgi:protoporphyrin/coproporphyrin ferrochelatase